ncbi:hypothetical protein ACTXT7_015252, partial [Hymenolepis weldensis]
DKHIRSAFQCFQLVVTDYLPTLNPNCYPACVDTAAKFGHQEHDLNISLAAIGSLVHGVGFTIIIPKAFAISALGNVRNLKLHLTDFLFQRERGSVEFGASVQEKGEAGSLWVEIFIHLADLVRDRRPAIRKSAGQTLFNTIECHSAQFHPETWSELLWTVFFPLLSDVQEKCARAPVEREGGAAGGSGGSGGGGLLVHHSRDTAAKQWAETVVLTLSGVARCFVSKQSQLLALDRFPDAWERLLSNAERSVLTPNSEIAQNALATLRILLNFNTKECSPEVSTSTWLAFWRNWVSIGRNFVEYFGSLTDAVSNDDAFQQQQNQGALTRKTSTSTFGAEFFSLYFELFPPLFPRIESKSFNSTFFAEFAEITAQGVLGPLFVTHHQTAVAHLLGGSTSTASATPSFMNSFTANLVDEQGLTQTQRSVFNCLSLIAESIKTSKTNAKNLLVPFFELLLRLSQYAVRIPRPGSNTNLVEAIPMNYIIFAEKCMELATEMYKNFADSEVLLCANGLLKIIEALRVPLAAKYKCQCRSTWLLASKCFIEAITVGVPIATKQKSTLLQPDSNGLSRFLFRYEKTLVPRIEDSLLTYVRNIGKGDENIQQSEPEWLEGENPESQIQIFPSLPPTLKFQIDITACQINKLWSVIFSTIRDFLFCQSLPTENLSGEEFQQHEALDCKYIDLICDLFLSKPEGMPPKFLEQLVGILGLGAIEASITAADFTLLDPSTLRPAPLSNPNESHSKRSSITMGSLQPFVHHSPSLTATSAVSNCPAVSSSGGDLRPFASREKFMHRCFEALLNFAFFSAQAGDSSLSSPKTTSKSGGANKPHIVLCRTAIRDILDRCRFILHRFVKSAQLTGKCPLPRARLSEVNFALQALALLLTTFTTSSRQNLPTTHPSVSASIDTSTWSYVIDIYPMVVDCIFVTEASTQLLPGIHRLLQLYGRLLQPKTNNNIVVADSP